MKWMKGMKACRRLQHIFSAQCIRTVVLLVVVSCFLSVSTGSFAANQGLKPVIDAALSAGPQADTQALASSIKSNLGDPEADRAYYTLGSAYLKKKDYAKAASAFQDLIGAYPASPYKFQSLYGLGYARFKSGRLSEARSVLDAVADGTGTTDDLKARARTLLAEMKSAGASDASSGSDNSEADGGQVVIGALLPLKGPYAVFGTDALNGVLLAAGVFGQGGGGVKVVARDVGTEAESAMSAVTELAGDPSVAGVIGPLFSSSAVDAAKTAQAKGMPIVTLTQKEGITGAGDFVFRNFLTPALQAEAVAGYACSTLGLERFAILSPQNNYGSELARLFEAEVKKCGGSVIKRSEYRQGTTDFSDEVKRLFGVQVKERREGRRRIKEYTPVSRIQALFIPDGAEAVALIVPYLKYYNIKGVQLIGTNGWNSERLVALSGDAIEGALFVDGFFPDSARAGTPEFTKRFTETYGKAPGVIEAQAYDAAAILISAIRLSGGRSADRRSVKKRLRSISDYTGAAGALSFDAKGEAVKKLFYLTVRDGRIVEAR